MSYTLQSNILTKTGYSAQQIKAAVLAVNPRAQFKDYDAFSRAEALYGINVLFIVAHAAVESAWGTSYYARARNNLFGFNAVDSNPDKASTYPTQAASIDFYANFLKRNYLTHGGRYYVSTTPHGVFTHYSSSHDAEAHTVTEIMNTLESHIAGTAIKPEPRVITNITGKYAMHPNDNFWKLEIAGGWPHGTLQALNPGLNPREIPVGYEINIPASAAHPAAATKLYAIKPGENMWRLENRWKLPHGALKGLNSGVLPRKIPVGYKLVVPAHVQV